MARLVTLVFAVVSVLTAVSAEDFNICKRHLHKLGVVNVHKFDVNPSTPTAGSKVQFTLTGSTEEDIVEGTVARVILQTLGVELTTYDFDICSLQGISCPITAGDKFEGSISHKLPFEIPEGVSVGVAVEFLKDEEVFGCYEVEMKVEDAEGKMNRFGFDVSENEYLFKKWMKQHGITFQDAEEFVKRKAIFAKNLIKIALHNAKGKSWKMGMNQFGHLEAEEFKKIYASGLILPKSSSTYLKDQSNMLRASSYRRMANEDIPSEVNWVTAGAVTPVKNQGACGSCWSFSTTGALEGAYFLKYKKLVSFSEQELVSCDEVDLGCNGGFMDNAYEWIKKNGGLCTEQDYPYTAGTGTRGLCRKSCKVVPNSAPVKYSDVQHKEETLESAVAKQPVAIAIEADQTSFQFYSTGVLTQNCGTKLDHGVLLVGYGSENGQDYWLVKNSWGPNWGDHGYIKLARGLSQQGGECGILLSPSFPEF
mmetsp:Transcript_35483/g.43836  ORF Transcript_35483/g.43836 Transcript_35483/m.43836 type:complete len:479 (+) Transcript_35483:276-1712(+)|eukprot:CAMPEP_0204843426 /NCGR_PEP_ID=MMETSP1346-20131115/47969_1 /ASSEMBLY_ACC=CAM_ASM_000771 /TAXON_ID=215587 /ORGANISM="Aplanochytrium stocchinoi, Strain GSBS06" /LENGTH=478 /DNA_ID=CAMNT_0051982565 /DNA_START=194 /DNA_END=1630 /DNA_ORIENTATION=+